MRHNLALVALLAVGLPGVASAQQPPAPAAAPEAGPAAPAEGGASEVDHLPVADDETPRDFGGAPDDVETVVMDGGNGAAAPDASGSHTVEKGDTLWDISGKYLNNPWYWPKVWSYNPQIENPHWIYPGDQIRLGADGQAAAVAGELPDLSKGTFDGGSNDDVTVAGRIGVLLPGSQLAPTAGFVTEEELAEAGTIEKAWEEKNLLNEGDRIYLSWPDRKTAQVGKSYVIFRTDRQIDHPTTGEKVGYLTRVVGMAKVVANDPREQVVVATIVRSTAEISRGDKIGPAVEGLSRRVDRKKNLYWVNGQILATIEENLAELGQGHLVFLDKGSRDGVAEGNTFEVVRATDGLEDDGYTPHYDPNLPKERIGYVMVVDARENTSAAIVVSSIRELRIGDRVEMKVADAN